jgi:hypothetical protein
VNPPGGEHLERLVNGEQREQQRDPVAGGSSGVHAHQPHLLCVGLGAVDGADRSSRVDVGGAAEEDEPKPSSLGDSCHLLRSRTVLDRIWRHSCFSIARGGSVVSGIGTLQAGN